MFKHKLSLALLYMAAAGAMGSDTGGTATGEESVQTSAQPKPPADPSANPPKPVAERVKHVKARVLAHCAHGAPNQVVSLPADVAKLAHADGVVDITPAAVAYAESLARAAE